MSTAATYEPLPRGRSALPPEVVEASQRRRLLDAMTELAAEKGLANLTVADLTAAAGVSRKSFYALFKDKTDCYIAGFNANSRILLGQLRRTTDADGVVEGFRAYVRALAASPVHARAYLLEGMRAGPDVTVHRERVHSEAVTLIRRALERGGTASNDNAIVALVGGVNELVCRELGRKGPRVAALEPDVIDLAVAVLRLSGADRENTK
jgi:AcrR family transcriptional regulator